MVSKRLEAAINKQINAELWSAYLYLSMSMHFNNEGLPGVANWFLNQFKEEQDHAHKFMNYMNAKEMCIRDRFQSRTGWLLILTFSIIKLDTLDCEYFSASPSHLTPTCSAQKTFPYRSTVILQSPPTLSIKPFRSSVSINELL